jgi:hypothetical protein
LSDKVTNGFSSRFNFHVTPKIKNLKKKKKPRVKIWGVFLPLGAFRYTKKNTNGPPTQPKPKKKQNKKKPPKPNTSKPQPTLSFFLSFF